MATVDAVIKLATQIFNLKEKKAKLKPEQQLAVRSMLEGKVVLAVLSTSFGKSLMFTVFGIARKNITKAPVSVLAIYPLKSIISNRLD